MEVTRGAYKRAVFVDTAAFIAMADPSDFSHTRASESSKKLRRQGVPVLTSNFVLAEFHAFAVKRRGPMIALAALEGILAGRTVVVQGTEADERHAMEILRLYTDKAYSMVDAISFAIMARLSISRAFTFDRHFAQHGFQVIGLDD